MKSVQWFQRRRSKCEKLTDDADAADADDADADADADTDDDDAADDTDDDGRKVMTKAHMAF